MDEHGLTRTGTDGVKQAITDTAEASVKQRFLCRWGSPFDFKKALYAERCLNCGCKWLHRGMRELKCDDCGHSWPRGIDCAPALVLTDHLASWVSWRIKAHSKGYYSHAMLFLPDGRLISQGWMLRVADWDSYLDGKHRVKLWTCEAWKGETAVRRITRQVDRYLESGPRRRRYDWLGIVGQALGLRWINFRGRTYCSEFVSAVLRKSSVEAPADRYPSPADLDLWCRSNPKMQVAALYDPSW